MRVVLDANILISAFVFPGGVPEAVYRLALEGRIQLVTSSPLLAELGRVLTEKFGRDPPAVADAVAQVAAMADVVKPSREMRVVKSDPTDDRVLEAAAEGIADVIVSGDRHLLRLGMERGSDSDGLDIPRNIRIALTVSGAAQCSGERSSSESMVAALTHLKASGVGGAFQWDAPAAENPPGLLTAATTALPQPERCAVRGPDPSECRQSQT